MNKKLYGTATVGTKGQVVIPADAREEIGIATGDRLYVIGAPGGSFVGFIKEEQLEAFIEKLNLNIDSLKEQTTKEEPK